jgi:hypothetical protein
MNNKLEAMLKEVGVAEFKIYSPGILPGGNLVKTAEILVGTVGVLVEIRIWDLPE